MSESVKYSRTRHPWRLAKRMVANGVALLPLVIAALLAGMLIYHGVEGLPWSDSFLNAAMQLVGMGPVSPIKTEAGKWLVGCYALFAGLVFLVVAGAMLSPVLQHVLAHWGRTISDQIGPRSHG